MNFILCASPASLANFWLLLHYLYFILNFEVNFLLEDRQQMLLLNLRKLTANIIIYTTNINLVCNNPLKQMLLLLLSEAGFIFLLLSIWAAFILVSDGVKA